MIAKRLRRWLDRLGKKTVYITSGSPWENSYCESFNGKLRDELLNGEIFYTLREAQVLIEQWRIHYNTIPPHSSLNYRPPAPETLLPIEELPNQMKAAKLTLNLDQPMWARHSEFTYRIGIGCSMKRRHFCSSRVITNFLEQSYFNPVS